MVLLSPTDASVLEMKLCDSPSCCGNISEDTNGRNVMNDEAAVKTVNTIQYMRSSCNCNSRDGGIEGCVAEFFSDDFVLAALSSVSSSFPCCFLMLYQCLRATDIIVCVEGIRTVRI